MSKYQLCRVCERIETQIVFNINMKAIPICDKCSRSIFVQQARWMSRWAVPEEIKDREVKKKKEYNGYAVKMIPCKDQHRHEFGDGLGCIHCKKSWSEIVIREEFFGKEKVFLRAPCNRKDHEFESEGGDCIHCGQSWADVSLNIGLMSNEDYIVFQSIGDDIEQESVPLPLDKAIKFYRDRVNRNPHAGYFLCKRLTQQEISESLE